MPERRSRDPRPAARAPRRARRSALVALAVAMVLGGTALTGLPAALAGGGQTFTASPGDDLAAALRQLQPGDTLELEPGTYSDLSPGRPNPDVLRPALTPGVSGDPITVTAADPANPPLLVGMVQFDLASFWQISHLRVQGTVVATPGLVMNGGNGWTVSDSEIFGAADTGALANVAIQGSTAAQTMPTNWQFTGNCVHDGGNSPVTRPGMMHEIYVTAQGAAYGQIVGNLLYNTPDGAAVKVGFGGQPGALGASDIAITGNTMVNNGRQILVFGSVSGISITRNLMALSTNPMTDGRTRPAVYLNRLVGSGSVVGQNYVWGSNRSIFDLQSQPGSWTDTGGNTVEAIAPALAGTGCQVHPTAAAAVPYGAGTLDAG